MRWFRHIARFVGIATLGALLVGCAGVDTTVRVGFSNSTLNATAGDKLGEADQAGVAFGGTVGITFGKDGVSKIEPCGEIGYVWGETEVKPEEVTTILNTIPGEICVAIDPRATGG